MRDYKKESAWAKNKYTRLVADIDKELATQFKENLIKENKSFTGWLVDNINKYLKKFG